MCPLRSYENFAILICAILCILFGYISNRRKDHHLHDSPFSDNLNRINIRSSNDRYGLILEYKIQIIYILTSSQSVLCHRVFSGLFCLFFLSSCFFFSNSFIAFLSPPFHVFYNLLTVLRGCFTPIGLIHLSQSLALLSLSFPFLLFSFSSFLFLSSLLFLFSLSLQIFGAATAAMQHRFRRAWIGRVWIWLYVTFCNCLRVLKPACYFIF